MEKAFFIITIIAMVFSSCKKEKDYEFKSGKMVYINGIDQPKFKSTERQYTVSEIVRNPEVQLAIYTYQYGAYKWTSRVFWDALRDTVNNRLLMRAEDIIDYPNGELHMNFIDALQAFIFIPNPNKKKEYWELRDNAGIDTVGYIPQEVIKNAREQIINLYNQERYDEIYELFHTAFMFYPCSGEEYKQILNGNGYSYYQEKYDYEYDEK